jgi:hypothetical protein
MPVFSHPTFADGFCEFLQLFAMGLNYKAGARLSIKTRNFPCPAGLSDLIALKSWRL